MSKTYAALLEQLQRDRAEAARPDAAANDSTELCAFCVSGATGTTGHAGVSQQAHEIPRSVRSSVQVACVFCGAKWVRRRVKAKTFEWLRVAQ